MAAVAYFHFPNPWNSCEFGAQSCLQTLSVFNSISVFWCDLMWMEATARHVHLGSGCEALFDGGRGTFPLPQPMKLLRVWGPIMFANLKRFYFNSRFFIVFFASALGKSRSALGKCCPDIGKSRSALGKCCPNIGKSRSALGKSRSALGKCLPRHRQK